MTSPRKRRPIDQMKEVSHCRSIEVGLECKGETSTVDCQGPYSCLVTHSSRHAVVTHLTEMRKVLSLPKPRSLNWLLYHYIEQTTSLHLCRCHVGAAIVISTHDIGEPRHARLGLLTQYTVMVQHGRLA